jgi:hypothetical protein
MQTNCSVDPVDGLHNCQEEKVPSVPFLLPSRIPGATGASIWIDREAQRDISASFFTYEESNCAFPSPTSQTLPRYVHSHLNNVVTVQPHDTQPVFILGDTDGMHMPMLPRQRLWHYETPEYEVESSFSSLSIVTNGSSRPSVHSPLAQRIWAACTCSVLAHRHSAFKLLERLRWWLLIPGRLEFLFWFGGAILLMSGICIFLFVTPVSTAWMGSYGPAALPAAHQSVVSCSPVHPTSLLMKLLLFMLHG